MTTIANIMRELPVDLCAIPAPLMGFVSFIQSIVDARIEHARACWESDAAAKTRADGHTLSIKKAARAIRISDATLQHACNEPVGSPWHLKHTRGEKRGGVGAAPYLIQRVDLEVWDRDQRAGFDAELRHRAARG